MFSRSRKTKLESSRLSLLSRYIIDHLSIKKFSIKQRIRTFYLLQKYLQIHNISNNECLQLIEKSSKTYSILSNKDLLDDFSEVYYIGDDKVIILVKQIGSDSVNGIIYKAIGFKEDNYLQQSIIISCKIMNIDDDNKKELKILKILTNEILQKRNIHFPLSYFTSICKEPSGKYSKYPELTHESKYFINFNEIADGDVSDLLDNYEIKDLSFYNNLLSQIFMAIYSFHKLGYCHNDAHYGNFLYHNIEKTNSHFEYNIFGKNYYIKNNGFLIVIWDFATANNYDESEYSKDYIKILNSIFEDDIPIKKIIISELEKNTEDDFFKFILSLNIFNNTINIGSKSLNKNIILN